MPVDLEYYNSLSKTKKRKILEKFSEDERAREQKGQVEENFDKINLGKVVEKFKKIARK